MKNWKYIEGAKTGNTAHSDKVEVIKRLLHANWSVQEIYELLKKEGYEVDKNFIERMKTGNKNQDWDVGNIDWDVGNFNGQWYVTKNGQKLVGPFMSMKEAERYLDGHKWELQNKYGNSKTGNELPWGKGINIPRTKEKYTFPDPKEIEKKIQEAIKRGESPAFIEGMKDVLKKAKEERNKRTGNDTPWEYAHRKPKVINDDKTGAEEFFKQLSDDVKEREDKDDADIEKVGNFKTGTSQLKPGDKVMSFGKKGTVKEVIGENTDNIYGEPLIKVEFEDGTTKTIGEHYMRKVGNKKLKFTDKKDGLKEFVYDEENDKGYIYYDGKLVDTIPHAGQGWLNLIKQKAFSSGVMNKVGNATPNYRYKDFLITNPEGHEYIVFLKDGRTVGYRGTTSKAQAEDWCDWHDPKTGKSIGNSKIGNSTWYEPRRMPFQPRSLQYAYEQAKKKGLSGQKLEAEMLRIAKTTPHDSAATESEMRKDVSEWVLSHGKPEDFVNNKRTGNEAPDDKFAYVMREFDEGKLKTPDGKVVTDPAQAKAIAYSESKKTENGLARARKAMNKGITMWKGNDSAYIKEDGTVSYLENNSFETDKDKFESQESAIKELSKQGYVKK